MGAKSTCHHMRTCSRDAQSRTVHETLKRGCFSLHDYRYKLPHKFSVAFFVHVVQQRNWGSSLRAACSDMALWLDVDHVVHSRVQHADEPETTDVLHKGATSPPAHPAQYDALQQQPQRS
jgi:hypothetical protein